MVRKSSLVNSANTGDAKSSSNKTVITFIIDAPPWGGSITANGVIYYHDFIDLSILFCSPQVELGGDEGQPQGLPLQT